MRALLPRSPAGRAVLAVLGAAAALNLLALVLDAVAPSPTGRPSSSFATKPRGFAAWAELARRHGHDVVALRDPPSAHNLPQGGTVVVLDAGELPEGQAAELHAFARRGGRVVAGGRRADEWLGELGSDVRWEKGGSLRARVVEGVPETAGVTSLRTSGDGHWAAHGEFRVAVRGERGPLLVVTRAGNGRIALLADSSPLQNRLLARDDNAALALALSGQRDLAFLETVHGYTRSGLGALPSRAKVALLLLLAAALAFMAARGRRLGPPEARTRPLPPPRRAYVQALATTLARGRDPGSAIEPVRRAALDRLGDHPHELPEQEAAALAQPARSHEDAVLIARAYSRLQTPPTRKVPA